MFLFLDNPICSRYVAKCVGAAFCFKLKERTTRKDLSVVHLKSCKWYHRLLHHFGSRTFYDTQQHSQLTETTAMIWTTYYYVLVGIIYLKKCSVFPNI